jgi:hypothetical protein
MYDDVVAPLALVALVRLLAKLGPILVKGFGRDLGRRSL